MVRCAIFAIVQQNLLSHGLTPREVEVLSLLARGKRAGDIAHILGISKRTVDAHRRMITSKLGAANSPAAVAIGIRDGVIKL
jgi:DNA-binding CsgD family transcriptional regulator